MPVGRTMVVKHALSRVQDLVLLDPERLQLLEHVLEVAV